MRLSLLATALALAATATVTSAISAPELAPVSNLVASAQSVEENLLQNDCEAAFRKYCGKQLDNLKAELQAVDVQGIVAATRALARCVRENSEPLRAKCLPGAFVEMSLDARAIAATEEEETDLALPSAFALSRNSRMQPLPHSLDDDCSRVVNSLCGKQMRDLSKAVAEHAEPQVIIAACRDLINCYLSNDEEISKHCRGRLSAAFPASELPMGVAEPALPLADEAVDYSILEADKKKKKHPCKDMLHKKCDMPMRDLKRALEETSISGIISSSLAVASCIMDNLKEIQEACTPFMTAEEEAMLALQADAVAVAQRSWTFDMDAVATNYAQEKHLSHNHHHHHRRNRRLQSFSEDMMLEDKKKKQSKCEKQLRKSCGKQLDALKRALEETRITGIVSSALATASCLIQNFQVIAEACGQPKTLTAAATEPNMVAAREPYHIDHSSKHYYEKEGKCHKELYKKCGNYLRDLKAAIKETAILDIVGDSFSVAGCVTRNAQDLLEKCFSKQTLLEEIEADYKKAAPLILEARTVPANAVVDDIRSTSMKKKEEEICHKELYHLCGKELRELKAAIEDTRLLDIVGLSLEVTGCTTRNAQDLLKVCVLRQPHFFPFSTAGVAADVREPIPATVAAMAEEDLPIEHRPDRRDEVFACIKHSKSVCRAEHDSVRRAIHHGCFFSYAKHLPRLGQCLADHRLRGKPCVQDVLAVAIRANMESYMRRRRKHHDDHKPYHPHHKDDDHDHHRRPDYKPHRPHHKDEDDDHHHHPFSKHWESPSWMTATESKDGDERTPAMRVFDGEDTAEFTFEEGDHSMMFKEAFHHHGHMIGALLAFILLPVFFFATGCFCGRRYMTQERGCCGRRSRLYAEVQSGEDQAANNGTLMYEPMLATDNAQPTKLV